MMGASTQPLLLAVWREPRGRAPARVAQAQTAVEVEAEGRVAAEGGAAAAAEEEEEAATEEAKKVATEAALRMGRKDSAAKRALRAAYCVDAGAAGAAGGTATEAASSMPPPRPRSLAPPEARPPPEMRSPPEMVFFKRGDSLQQDFAALLLLEQARDTPEIRPRYARDRDTQGCSLGTQGGGLDSCDCRPTSCGGRRALTPTPTPTLTLTQT